jgi:hypothetical protein
MARRLKRNQAIGGWLRKPEVLFLPKNHRKKQPFTQERAVNHDKLARSRKLLCQDASERRRVQQRIICRTQRVIAAEVIKIDVAGRASIRHMTVDHQGYPDQFV